MCHVLEIDFHAMWITLFAIPANSAMTSGITFSRVIALLARDNKTMLSPLQESFSACVEIAIGTY